MSVDIIIPVYNAFDDLQLCLQSIYKYTDLAQNRLILINDNSPDERVRSYLDEQIRKHVLVIHNRNNMGFSNNINLGMRQSEENDVILLNSDTIVTKGWVEKISACAYSSRSIGTVTPLSNNATLCSVPAFCEENRLPEGMSIDQAASIVEACSMKKYPRITVAHGFCMYVKRELIHTIGYFDAETFGRGYGEENDFCNRAEQMGYIHVMCDDTYIYHSGTKSFVSEEKAAYIKKHEAVLEKRYPVQMYKNAVHCRDNPNGWVGQNVGFYFDIWNGRKNILYVLQSDFREDAEDHVGGTQLHVKHLALGLRKQFNIFVAARNGEYLQVTAYSNQKEYIFRFPVGPRSTFPLIKDRNFSELFCLILKGFRIDFVHVHHTASTSLDIYYEADKLGIPVIFTAHDFYSICPNITLLDAEGKVCIGQEDSNCAKCLNKKLGIYEKNNFYSLWKKEYSKALGLCSRIIVPSKSAGEVLASYYPDYQNKIQVIEHGMDQPELLKIDKKKIVYTEELIWRIEKLNQNARCPFLVGVAYLKSEPNGSYKVILKITDRKGKTIYLPTTYGRNQDVIQCENRFYGYIPNNLLDDGNLKISVILATGTVFYINEKKEECLKNISFQRECNFKVAFIGGINEEKGGEIVYEIIRRGTSDIEWYVFGGIGEESLYQLKKENLVKTGYYHQEDLCTLLKYHNIDAICILSKCSETFSYTLSEAVMNQIPVIVTDIGALGQRTREGGYGKTVSSEKEKTVNEVFQIIEKWKEKGVSYQKAKEEVEKYRHKSISEMLRCYQALYENDVVLSGYKGPDINYMEREKLYHAFTEKNCHFSDVSELLSKINKLEERVRNIDNNVTIHFVQKFTDRKFPFKKQIRAFMQKYMK